MGLLLHVLGTDTGVGKTVLTAGLARALNEAGHAVRVAKPFATGAGADGIAPDTARLVAALPGSTPAEITAWSAPEPLAPRAAAERSGEPIPVAAIADTVKARAADVDLLVIEGIGGVQTPIAPDVSYLDFAAGLGGSAIVVARPSLGTLNHTRLSVDACLAAHLPVLGVVCSHAEDPAADDLAAATNPAALEASIAVPVWPAIPHLGALADGPPPTAPFAGLAECIAARLLSGGDTLPIAHELITRVRYGETDQMGMVYHGDYFQYLDMGRTELLRARGLPYAELERRGALLTVTEASCRYLAPARYDDRLRVRTELVAVQRVRIGFTYAIHRVSDGTLVATGRTTLACIDRAGRPRRLPQELQELLAAPKATA